MKIRLLLLLLSTWSLSSCTSDIIYRDKSVDELIQEAAHKNKSLCLILGGGSQCQNCQNKINEIKKAGILSAFRDQYLFGEANGGDSLNIHLHYSLIMESLPMIYIFSPQGKLLAYLSDLNDPENLRTLLESTVAGSPFPQNQHREFRSSFRDLIKMQNFVLSGENACNQAKADTAKLNTALQYIRQAITIEPYFYNLYLASRIHKALKQTEEADSCAYQALSICTNGFQQAVYYSLREELKKECPKFIKEEEKKPQIEISEKELDGGTIPLHSCKEFIFSLKNKGQQPLIINYISSSCNCISSEWPKQPILPGKREKISVKFKADQEGKFVRTIFILSNATEPTVRLTLKGEVK